MERKFLLSPPIYYEKAYDFSDDNDFYVRYRDREVNRLEAWKQWAHIVTRYMEKGARIHIVEASEGLSELTFVGDSIFLFGKKAVISRFRHPERQKEAAYMKEWALRKGFEIMEIPEGYVFEGNAEAFYSHYLDVIIMGYGGNRTSIEVADMLEDFLGIRVIPVEKFDFHLDVVLFLLKKYVIYARGKVSEESIERLNEAGFKTIPVPPHLIEDLGLNSTYIGNTVFVNDSRNAPELKKIYLSLGFDVEIVKTSEFHLVGGGVKCLTLEHYKFQEMPDL